MNWYDLPRPAIFAHRGASAYAPENTLSAFSMAVSQGADAIELDAKLSADGAVVVFHDLTTERTTGIKARLADLTLEELRRLDAGSHYDIAFRGEPVPTLEEVFAAVGRQIFINVELTNYAAPTDALPEKVVELVCRFGLQDTVLFSSFSPISLLRARRLLPDTPVGLLCPPGAKGWLARSWFGALLHSQALHPAHEDTTPALVERCHQRGQHVNVYTVNREHDLQRMLKHGVDGVITDDPLLARKLIKFRSHQRQENRR